MYSDKIQDFFKVKLPNHIIEGLDGFYLYKKNNHEEISNTIDFSHPFLRIEKIIIFLTSKDIIIQSRSIAIGTMTQADTEGHYNNTIFLAFLGRMMGQAASVHVGLLFPNTAPQILRVKNIEPIIYPDKTLWKPNKKGSVFFVETVIIKKKINMVIVKSRISFGDLIFGFADDATIILTPKETIYKAKELPS